MVGFEVGHFLVSFFTTLLTFPFITPLVFV